MGFWDVVKRMAAGKPAFIVQDTSITGEPSADAPVKTKPVGPSGVVNNGRRVDASGRKIIPEVVVVRIDKHRSGDSCRVYAHIQNNANFTIELDKMLVFGQSHGLSRWLKPGERHECEIYNGPVLRHDNYRDGDIYFKDTESGDCFCARHYVEYDFESDGSYIPVEMHLVRPIRDV